MEQDPVSQIKYNTEKRPFDHEFTDHESENMLSLVFLNCASENGWVKAQLLRLIPSQGCCLVQAFDTVNVVTKYPSLQTESTKLGTVVYSFNSTLWESEAGGYL